MPEMNSNEVDLLGDSIRYDVRRSADASRARIDVDVNGVRVVIPVGCSIPPERLLAENASWVVEKTNEYDTYRERIPDRRFEAGETFPYLDEPHEVVIERRSASDVEGETLALARHHVEQTSVKRALETLYRRKARETFEGLADKRAPEMGVSYGKIEVRNQRTKWGSCSARGTLGLNWRLLMAPMAIVEYVVIHELAHLREPNHSDAFWSLVAAHDPECEAHDEWLSENSPRLVFSDEDL